ADADVKAAEAKIEVSLAQKKRSDEMFKAHVITAQEHESSALDYANAIASVVRARANLDLAKQRLEDATVTAPVAGTVIEKTVSQAGVQQGVTMFPVLVTLSNLDGALKPGMNGEVSVTIEERKNVLAVPNDAVKNIREAVATAPLLGLDPDSVQAQLRSQFQGRGGFGGAAGGQRGQRGGNGARAASPGDG